MNVFSLLFLLPRRIAYACQCQGGRGRCPFEGGGCRIRLLVCTAVPRPPTLLGDELIGVQSNVPYACRIKDMPGTSLGLVLNCRGTVGISPPSSIRGEMMALATNKERQVRPAT